MKNKAFRGLSMMVGMVMLSQAAAFADTIEGRVARVKPGALEVTVYDPEGRPYPNNLSLITDSRTQVSGIRSLSALRRQDAVSVDVIQLETRQWYADRVLKFQEVNAQPATQNPPPSMRDVLGNPVVRGALLGAATGAIASSASGGKAGKGALVGAGVGAAAGLLGNLLSSDSSQS